MIEACGIDVVKTARNTGFEVDTRKETCGQFPPCGTVAEIGAEGLKPDCIGCHMPPVARPSVSGAAVRSGRRHLFHGGPVPAMVKSALQVRHKTEELGGTRMRYVFTLTNVGAAHYLPSGTPGRHLTLELRLRDREGDTVKHESFLMERYILWRPFIVDLKDTRLPHGKPVEFSFEFSRTGRNPPTSLDVVVTYHLLHEERRKKIGFRIKSRSPIPSTGKRWRCTEEGRGRTESSALS